MIHATLQNREEIAENTVECQFQLSEAVNFQPGGYFKLILPHLIKHDPEGNSRKFSFVNSPSEKTLATIAFRVSDSGFKQTLLTQPIGSVNEIGKIKSKLSLPESVETPLVFIAGGIGVTPFISILRYIEEKHINFRIHMFYFNPGEKSAAYLNELMKLEQNLPNFQLVICMTRDESWRGEKRKLTPEFLREYLQEVIRYHYFVIGTPVMVESSVEILKGMGISPNQMQIEDFEGYED